MWTDKFDQDYDEIEVEIASLKEWIDENPGKFDGVAEKERDIRYLRSILREMREQSDAY